jgi:hypothetical protein
MEPDHQEAKPIAEQFVAQPIGDPGAWPDLARAQTVSSAYLDLLSKQRERDGFIAKVAALDPCNIAPMTALDMVNEAKALAQPVPASSEEKSQHGFTRTQSRNMREFGVADAD